MIPAISPGDRFGRIRFVAALVLTAFMPQHPACSGDERVPKPTTETASPEQAMQVFENRIMPIFRSPNPSSCVQCHLSSVDIKQYILPSHQQTFAALRRDGLVDLERPEKSKILTLISMGDQDQDAGAKRLHAKTRKAEYDAFSTWIKACCKDAALISSTTSSDAVSTIGPERPLEIVRHARKSRVVEAFARDVWSQRMRCFPCHTPHEIDPDNPKHAKPAERHKEFVKTWGARMNLFEKTPERTLASLIASSRSPKRGTFPLINLKHPAKSLLVLKPTAKIPAKGPDGKLGKPSSGEPVSHMGGLKMHVDDHSYKLFLSFLEDYAAIVGDEYRLVEDLPQDNWVPTQRILRVKEVPSTWPVGKVVQLFVHTRDGDSDKWSKSPIAFTQGTVTPRGFVNGALLLISPDEPIDEDRFPLTPGRYLIKAYVDQDQILNDDPTAILRESEYVGSAETDAQWKIGFPQAQVLPGGDFSD